MGIRKFIPWIIIIIVFCSCKEKENPVESFNPIEEHVELYESEKQILSELKKYVTPCNTSFPYAEASDLKVLDGFAEATILGLGEATHGTLEFFQMKHRIFKYFVEQHGFKIFGFEADMGECIFINRFITRNQGTIEEVMNKMHFWTWKTQEVKELILWMNQYNKGKSDAEKIHLLGVDCQFKDYNKQLILEYLNKYDLSYPVYVNNILEEIDRIEYTEIKTMSASVIEKLKSKCDSLSSYFNDNMNRLTSHSGQFEYDLIERLIIQTKQFIDVYSNSTYNYRDKYMAENSVWLTKLLGNDTKVVLWAHNGHVAKDPFYSGSGSQGFHIRMELDYKYKVIAFSFSKGSFRAVYYDDQNKTYLDLTNHTINKLPPRESSNFIFHFSQPENFILINENVKQSASLLNWLNTTRKFLMIGAVYSNQLYDHYFYNYNLLASFDAVIHFQSTNAAIAYR